MCKDPDRSATGLVRTSSRKCVHGSRIWQTLIFGCVILLQGGVRFIDTQMSDVWTLATLHQSADPVLIATVSEVSGVKRAFGSRLYLFQAVGHLFLHLLDGSLS